MHNPNCDGEHCLSEVGKVKVVPIGANPDSGNLLLCRGCFFHEMQWRHQRNRELEPSAQFPVLLWEELSVYDPE